MLQSFAIDIVADIRRFPGSGKFPQFNKPLLEASLKQASTGYIHMPELGGRRKPQPGSVNTAWRSASFQGYADYMQTAAFKMAIKELEHLAQKQRVAFMCSEAVWWRCHRSLVSDYLKADGWKVWHIMEEAKATEHPYTAPAKVVQGKLLYS